MQQGGRLGKEEPPTGVALFFVSLKRPGLFGPHRAKRNMDALARQAGKH